MRERVGELTADFFSDVEVKRAINEAQRRFCAEEPWTWLTTEWSTTIAALAATIALPTNVSPSRAINIAIVGGALGTGVGRLLERVEPSAGFTIRYAYKSGAVTGIPEVYYIASAAVGATTIYTARFLPVPAVLYTVEGQYSAVPVDLSAGADIPKVPDEYQEALPAWAAGKLFLKEMSISQKANEQFGLYYKVLEQAREDQQNLAMDEVVAWGRSRPFSGPPSEHDWVMSRIPPTGLG